MSHKPTYLITGPSGRRHIDPADYTVHGWRRVDDPDRSDTDDVIEESLLLVRGRQWVLVCVCHDPADLAHLEHRHRVPDPLFGEAPCFEHARATLLSSDEAAYWMVTHTGRLPDELREAVLGRPLVEAAEATKDEQRPVATPTTAAKPYVCPVELHGVDEPVLIHYRDGRVVEKHPIEDAKVYKVLEVLAEAHPTRLSEKELDARTPATGYRKYLSALHKSGDADWKAVLHLPGKRTSDPHADGYGFNDV